MTVNFANKSALETLTARLEATLTANTEWWRLGRRAERAEKSLERWLERQLAPIGEELLQERLERARWQLANAEHYVGGYISNGWVYGPDGFQISVEPELLEVLRDLQNEVFQYHEAIQWQNGIDYVSSHSLPPVLRAEYDRRKAIVERLWEEAREARKVVRAEWRKALGKPEGYHPCPEVEAAELAAAFPTLTIGAVSVAPEGTEGAKRILARAQEALADLEEEAWALVA